MPGQTSRAGGAAWSWCTAALQRGHRLEEMSVAAGHRQHLRSNAAWQDVEGNTPRFEEIYGTASSPRRPP